MILNGYVNAKGTTGIKREAHGAKVQAMGTLLVKVRWNNWNVFILLCYYCVGVCCLGFSINNRAPVSNAMVYIRLHQLITLGRLICS